MRMQLPGEGQSHLVDRPRTMVLRTTEVNRGEWIVRCSSPLSSEKPVTLLGSKDFGVNLACRS